MGEWMKVNQKLLLYLFIILILSLLALYMNVIRPVSLAKVEKETELNSIENEIQTFQMMIDNLEPQDLTGQEQASLLKSIPIHPNVEQVIADLEKTELQTRVAIDSIAIGLAPNPMTLVNAEQSQSSEITEQWRHIFPEAVYQILSERINPVRDVKLSFVEFTVAVNGFEEDVDVFVSELEKLDRTVHIQSYLLKESTEYLEGVNAEIIFRAFYCEDFAAFFEGGTGFELDYTFDPSLINRFKPSIEDPTEQEEMVDRNDINPDHFDHDETSMDDNYKHDTIRNEGDKVFYIVQTGAYTNVYYLNYALQTLVNKGFHPKVLEGRMNLIYTAIDVNEAAAIRKAEHLTNSGFASFAFTFPFKAEQSVIDEAYDVVAAISEVGREAHLPSERLTEITTKIATYLTKADQLLTTANHSRKVTLEKTMTSLVQAEVVLTNYQTSQDPSLLWEVEGLILDFVLLLNSSH
ncbi:hypothetical protein H1D32_06925 [Anaerobacillus sp. CMMVII]|uniref:hypothetical protein n=1 Tax=Anaerobacillus sp. CMMVII TaxID=2755588 RepID=UPI0021B7501D|nr:hypothetical protein [Anaerobacillus sp. CMMVII]MCT8137498.1 hypothetical protein [Anaerobacillus sp. CMMVII]